MKKVIVKQDIEKQIPTEILAESIVSISEGVKKLRAGKLNDKALFLLIQHASPSIGKYGTKPISQAVVKSVLEGMESLSTTFLKKKPSA